MRKPQISMVVCMLNQDALRVTFSDGSERSICSLALISEGLRETGDGGYLTAVHRAWQHRPELFEQVDGAAHV